MTGSKEMFQEIRQAETGTRQFIGNEPTSKPETGLSLELQDWKSLNKAAIKDKVDAVITSIQEGWVDPVEALIFAKKGVETFSSLEKNVREHAESKGVGKDGLEKFGVKVTEAMTGVSYDYSGCGDVILNKLQEKAAELDAKIKARQKFLQTVTSKQITGDSDTGEAWEVIAPIKKGKLGLKVEIK